MQKHFVGTKVKLTQQCVDRIEEEHIKAGLTVTPAMKETLLNQIWMIEVFDKEEDDAGLEPYKLVCDNGDFGWHHERDFYRIDS